MTDGPSSHPDETRQLTRWNDSQNGFGACGQGEGKRRKSPGGSSSRSQYNFSVDTGSGEVRSPLFRESRCEELTPLDGAIRVRTTAKAHTAGTGVQLSGLWNGERADEYGRRSAPAPRMCR